MRWRRLRVTIMTQRNAQERLYIGRGCKHGVHLDLVLTGLDGRLVHMHGFRAAAAAVA